MKKILINCVLLAVSGAGVAQPLLTGVVEDVSAQSIEMPSLPGAWQRQIEWMAPEGSMVKQGDLIVRLDPGSLIAEEEKARVDLEKKRFSVEKALEELRLAVLSAKRDVVQAESDLRLAELDAVIPAETIPRLDFERYQLTLQTAEQTLARRKTELANQQAALSDQKQQAALELRQAEVTYERMKDALQQTSIYAEKSGYMIYAENRFTGKKVFPGDTLYSGYTIASVASRDDLRVRFWVHEADFLDVSQGAQLKVTADAEGTRPFSVAIEWRATQAVEKQDWSGSGYFEAIARPLESLSGDIMPGMSVLGVPADQASP